LLARAEIYTVVLMKVLVFLDMASCVYISNRKKETSSLKGNERKVKEIRG